MTPLTRAGAMPPNAVRDASPNQSQEQAADTVLNAIAAGEYQALNYGLYSILMGGSIYRRS